MKDQDVFTIREGKTHKKREINVGMLRRGIDTFTDWEEHIPFELLDIIEDERNIETQTLIARKEHGFPKRYLVISETVGNAILVLDTITNKVYTTNFEGEDELLLKGELKETWSTFFDFLKEYFHC